jgi:hypothetical protein
MSVWFELAWPASTAKELAKEELAEHALDAQKSMQAKGEG